MFLRSVGKKQGAGTSYSGQCWLFLQLCSVALMMVSASTGIAAEIVKPSLGYVFDQGSQSLRPIWGVPGASRLGEALDFGVKLAAAQVAPSQQYALGIAPGTGRLSLIDLQAQISRPVDAVGEAVSRFTFSANGTAVAVLLPQRNSLSILRGLPGPVVVQGQVHLPFDGARLQALAVRDDGGLVLMSGNENGISRVYAGSPASGPRLVAILGKVTGLQFLPGGTDAVAADEGADEILLLKDLLGSQGRTVLATRASGISRPVGLAVERSGRRIFVGNAGNGTVTSFNLNGQDAEVTSCNCTLTALEPLRGESVFRLTELSNQPLWVLERGPVESRALFVPHGRTTLASLPERKSSRPIRVPRRRLDP